MKKEFKYYILELHTTIYIYCTKTFKYFYKIYRYFFRHYKETTIKGKEGNLVDCIIYFVSRYAKRN